MARLLTPASVAMMLLALMSWSAPTAAQPASGTPAPDPPADATAAAAMQRYEAGQQAAKKKQWLEAREAFLEAWKLRRHYQIAANLGRAELMTGSYRDAAEHLTFFLREATADVSAEDRAQAQQWLDEAKAKIGTLTLRVTPAGAEVLVDGTRLPAPLPQELYVEPGKRVIEARLEGHVSAQRELTLIAGQAQIVELELAAEPAPVRAAAEQALPPPAPARNPLWIGVGIGAGVAAVAGGAALLVMAMGKASQQDEIAADNYPIGRSAEWLELDRSRTMMLNMAMTSFIGAAVAGAATATYALTGAGPKPAERVGRIRVYPAGTGIGITGTW